MRGSWFVGVVGVAACATSQHRLAEPPHAEAIAPPIVSPLAFEPKPVPAKPVTLDRYGARDLFEPVIHHRDTIAIEARWRSAEPAIVDVAEIDFLGRCARDFILRQPDSARRVLVAALTHYVTACDAETGKLVLERPLGFDSRDRRSSSDVVFLGMLAPRGAGLVLRVSSCGESSFDRISVAGPDHQWTSPRLEVRREPNGCAMAELPYTRALGKVITRALDEESTLRFEGSTAELAFTDQLRDELRSVLDVVDAITEP